MVVLLYLGDTFQDPSGCVDRTEPYIYSVCLFFFFLYTHPCDKLSSVNKAQQENVQIASITTLVL